MALAEETNRAKLVTIVRPSLALALEVAINEFTDVGLGDSSTVLDWKHLLAALRDGKPMALRD